MGVEVFIQNFCSLLAEVSPLPPALSRHGPGVSLLSTAQTILFRLRGLIMQHITPMVLLIYTLHGNVTLKQLSWLTRCTSNIKAI